MFECVLTAIFECNIVTMIQWTQQGLTNMNAGNHGNEMVDELGKAGSPHHLIGPEPTAELQRRKTGHEWKHVNYY